MSQLPGGPIAGNLPWGGMGAGGGTFQAAAASDPVAQQIGDQYSSAYNSALAMNQANYNNILQGYQQTSQQQQSAQDAISRGYQQAGQNIYRMQQSNLTGQNQQAANIYGSYGQLGTNVQQALDPMRSAMLGQQQALTGISGGYGQLQRDVLGGIANIGNARSQEIADSYARQRGQLAQNLISSGLGNTTVQGAMQRGLSLDANKAQTLLAEQIAQLQAGYRSQLGQAGLGFSERANAANVAQQNLLAQNQAQYTNAIGQNQLGFQERMLGMNLQQQNQMAQDQMQMELARLGYQNLAAQQNASLANQQLGWMNSVSAPYPDASHYSALLAQRGQALEADKTRQTMASLYQQQLDMQRQQQQQAAFQTPRGTWTQGSIGGGGGSLPAFNAGQPGYAGLNYPSPNAAGLPRPFTPIQGPGQPGDGQPFATQYLGDFSNAQLAPLQKEPPQTGLEGTHWDYQPSGNYYGY